MLEPRRHTHNPQPSFISNNGLKGRERKILGTFDLQSRFTRPRRRQTLTRDARQEVIDAGSLGYLVTTSPQSPSSPSAAPSPCGVRSRTSGAPGSHGVTGGVYKARERIHRGVADPRLLAIPASCSRVTDCNPNLDRLFPIRSASRHRNGLYRPL